jgi:hypothetical protein
MKHFYITLITLLTFTQAFAQKDFRPGYVIQHGDTVRGYVDYRGAVRSSKVATFKTTLNSNEQVYTPTQLMGYGFDKENKVYESKTIPATEAQAEQQLFLHALVKGKASLYTYRDDSDLDRFFFSKDDAALVKLTEQAYTRKDPKTGKSYRVVDQPFLDLLASAFNDCPDLKEDRLKSVKLHANSLIKLTEEYNQCVGSTQYIKEPKKTVVTIMPVLTFARPSLETDGTHYYAKGSYSHTGLGLGGGLAMQFSYPAMSEKLSILLELLYAPYRFEGEIRNKPHNGRTTDYELLFDLHYLKIPAQLRYTFPKGKIRPYANLGVSYSYAAHSNRVEKKSSTFQSTSYEEESEALSGRNFKRQMFGAVAGAGLILPIRDNALFIETRYESMDGITRMLSLPNSIKSLSLQVGYSF